MVTTPSFRMTQNFSMNILCYSAVDKSHLRLASAKAILRLSKLWESKIPVDIFYLTLGTSQV